MRILFGNLAFRTPLQSGKERFLFGTGCRFPWSLIKNVDEPPRYAMLPLFMAYAAALLEKEGCEVRVIDGVPLNLTLEEFCTQASAAKPEFLFFEPCTSTFPVTLQAAARLRQSTGAKVILAGPHVSAMPAEVLQQHSEVDYVLRGEYEFALLHLLASIRGGDLSPTLPGICSRRLDGTIQVQPPCPTIEPLDLLPFPARHLFPSNENNDLSLYHDGFCQHRPAIQMHSSRGCPFRCDFCLWAHTLYSGRGRHRTFSPSRVVDEMVHVQKRHGAKEVYFDDDAFNINRRHALGICDEIRRRGVKIPFSFMSDIRLLDAELLSALAKAGCIGFKFGIESLAPEVQALMQKQVQLQKIREVTAVAAKLGLKTHGTVCVGLPGETLKSVEQSFDYCRQIDADSIQFYVSTPLPGTPYYAKLNGEGRVRSNCWTDFDGTRCNVNGAFGDPQALETFAAQAGGRWLRHKLTEPGWACRQGVYLFRLARGQGWRGLTRRFGRALELLRQG